MIMVYMNIQHMSTNKNKIIIFGTKDVAELAHWYITNDTNYEVIAFSVNAEFLTEKTFKDLPVVAFENIQDFYHPDEYMFFAPMTGVGMNTKREKIYNSIKNKGYKLFSYISSRATVLTDKIGDNCFILEDNTIQPYVSIGNNVVLWSGNHIGHHSVVGNNVFFTSHVVLSGHCNVGDNCWLGVNSTIRDQISLANKSLVGMGSLITKNTEENGFYMGTPAKKQEKKSYEVY